MFNKKRIERLERQVKELESIVCRMHNYLQTATEPRIVEFVPDPEMSDEIKRKMN